MTARPSAAAAFAAAVILAAVCSTSEDTPEPPVAEAEGKMDT